jgi:hypothetical protein
VNGGQIVSGAGTGLINVVWNNTPTSSSNQTSLQVNVTGCSNTASSQLYGPKAIFVRSLSQTAIGPVSVSGDVSFGSNSPVTLSIPPVNVPMPTGSVTTPASGYFWTIPQGWSYATGQVSDGSTPVLINNFNGNSIRVTPAPATGGTVTVRAADTSCGFNGPSSTVSSQSLPASTTITRPVPQPVIISNRTPNGGPITLFCGQLLQDEQVRVGPVAAGGFSNYNFSISGVVGSSGGLNSATPSLFVTGPGTGTIGLSATYSRNGASTSVSAPVVTVTVRPEVAPVTLKPIGSVCPGRPVRLEVTPVPGAAFYRWTIPAPFSPAGVITTPASQPYLDVTSPASRQSQTFTVRVEAGNGSCTPSSTQQSGKLGDTAGYLSYWGPGLNQNATPQEVCGSSDLYVSLITDLNLGPATDITWTTTDGATILPNVSTGDGYPQVVVRAPAGGYLVGLGIYARYTDACGNGRTLSLSFTVVAGQRSDGAYCTGGYDARLAPPVAVYPNPADDKLFVEQGGGLVALYNAQGQPVSTRTAKPGLVHLNVKQLPEGLYYLLYHTAAGQPVREQVQIKH